jgi:acetylornithine deacetylase/succinyl-diaminopimelate desuccinylase family protein
MDIINIIKSEELLNLLSKLISIKSVNPHYDEDGGEKKIGDFVIDFFKSNQIRCETQEVFPNRCNVIGRLNGSEPDKTLLFIAHLDTVSTAGMIIDPFEPVIKDGRIYGRGSCDTKGGLAAMLYALKVVKEAGIQSSANIVLVATADEEYTFRGIVRLVEAGIRAGGAIIAEPTGLDVVVAHKGVLRWRIRTRGRAAHSSMVDLGVNAVVKMAKVIQVIETRLVPLYKLRWHPLVGCPTINIGIIEGGTQGNIVPDSCMLELDRRTVPGESTESVLREFIALLEEIKAVDPEFDATMEKPLVEELPLETREDERVVAVTCQACHRVSGNSRICGAPYGTEASLLSHAGIPSIVLGPGSIDQAHTAAEYVSIEQVVKAAELYLRIMLDF